MPTDSYDPNATDSARQDDVLPQELAPMHTRLEADGAAWRRRLPSAEPLVRRVVRAGPPRQMRTQRDDADTTPIPILNTPPLGDTIPMKNGRLRGIAAATVAVVIVVLFAVLLRSFAGGGQPGKGSTPTAGTSTAHTPPPAGTPTAVAGKWTAVPGLSFSNDTGDPFGLTIVPSPSDASVAYALTEEPSSLRRTDDSGVTWHTVKLPGPSQETQISAALAYASPLDARTLFVTVSWFLADPSNPASCPTLSDQGKSLGVVPRHGGILASGSIPCTASYRSTDSGAHWSLLRFPVPGYIGTSDAMLLQSEPVVIQAQGTRLYALLSCGPLCSGTTDRVVFSDNGGATWKLADAGLAARQICDYAAAPGSHMLFIVTKDTCDSADAVARKVWLSDNPGSGNPGWVQSGQLPALGEISLIATTIPGSTNKPLLYASMPDVVSQGHGFISTYSPEQFYVSEDGGKTWNHSPTAGVSDKAEPRVAPYGSPLVLLADGNIAVAFKLPNGQAAVYGWKSGAKSWTQLTASVPGAIQSIAVAPAPLGGHTIYWAVALSQEAGAATPELNTPTPQNGQAGTVQYTVLKYVA